MNLASLVDPTRCYQLVSGVFGIYFSYLVTGVIHQYMLKMKYLNNYTNLEENFVWPAGFLIFPCGITWIIGSIVNHFQIKKQQRTHIPMKNAAICGVTVAVSTLTYTYAIYLTNFPVVMMFKSCNILSVILVGVLCSRVKDKKLKLGVKKIIVGILVTAGIIMFKIFDPESTKKEEKKTEIVGIILLVVSLLADGFLPDFQAEIKSQYKPQPMEMMTEINKWVAIISLLYSITLLEIFQILTFIFQHRLFIAHMLIMGVLSTVGQMFVYRMIKQFKQHFPPFVITTRKIFTVGLSIFYYKHETNVFQLAGLFLVFAIVTFEFVTELMGEQKQPAVKINLEEKPNQTSDVVLQIEPQVSEPISEAKQNVSLKQQKLENYGSQIQDNEKKKYEARLGQEEKDKAEDLIGKPEIV